MTEQHDAAPKVICALADLFRIADEANPDSANLTVQCNAIRSGFAVTKRLKRALVEVTGADRADWLHNVITNEVKGLAPGQGAYSFATNSKGRIQFDLNVFCTGNALWLDLDAQLADQAIAHLDKYLIAEDVTLTDRSPEFVRLALLGQQSASFLQQMGIDANTTAQPPHLIEIPEAPGVVAMRTDFTGSIAYEVAIPLTMTSPAPAAQSEAGELSKPTIAGEQAIEACRIEAVVPRFGVDITDESLPAETGLFERAVSHTKGCFIGHEIIERMRARGAAAKHLVGLRIQGNDVPEPGTELAVGEEVVGKITSACVSPTLDEVVALGIVKSGHEATGTTMLVTGDAPREATVTAPPVTIDS